MSVATTAAFTKSTALLNTHLQAGHSDPSHPSWPKFLKDLRTHLTLTRRFLYAVEKPATEHEILTYLVRETPTRAELENLVTELGDAIKAAAAATGANTDAAVGRVIDLINADRTESNAQKAQIAELQAKAETDAETIASLQAQIDAGGAIDPAEVQEAIDSLAATNAKLADLDSDPLTPV